MQNKFHKITFPIIFTSKKYKGRRNPIKSKDRTNYQLYVCAPISELPPNISTIVDILCYLVNTDLAMMTFQT